MFDYRAGNSWKRRTQKNSEMSYLVIPERVSDYRTSLLPGAEHALMLHVPVLTKRRRPLAQSLLRQFNHTCRGHQRPGYAFSCEWFGIATRISQHEDAL